MLTPEKLPTFEGFINEQKGDDKEINQLLKDVLNNKIKYEVENSSTRGLRKNLSQLNFYDEFDGDSGTDEETITVFTKEGDFDISFDWDWSVEKGRKSRDRDQPDDPDEIFLDGINLNITHGKDGDNIDFKIDKEVNYLLHKAISDILPPSSTSKSWVSDLNKMK